MENLIAVTIVAILLFFAWLLIPKMWELANDIESDSRNSALESLNIVRLIGLAVSVVVSIASVSVLIYPIITESNLLGFIKIALFVSIFILTTLLAFGVDLSIKKMGNLLGSLIKSNNYSSLLFITTVATTLILHTINYISIVASSNVLANNFIKLSKLDNINKDTLINITNINKQQLDSKIKRVRILQNKLDALDINSYTDSFVDAKEKKIDYWQNKSENTSSSRKRLEYQKYISDLELEIAKHKERVVGTLKNNYISQISRLQNDIYTLKNELKNSSNEAKEEAAKIKDDMNQSKSAFRNKIYNIAFLFIAVLLVLDLIGGIMGNEHKNEDNNSNEYKNDSEDSNKDDTIKNNSIDDYIFNKIPIEKQLIILRAMIDLKSWGKELTQGAIKSRAASIVASYKTGLKRFTIGNGEFVKFKNNPIVNETVDYVVKNGTANSFLLELLNKKPELEVLFLDKEEEAA